jgi:hypothetical protein
MRLVKLFLLGMLLSVLAVSVGAVQIPKTCSDSDSGHGVEQYFTGAYVDSTPPVDNRDYDNCFGKNESTENHEKLREYYCSDPETNTKEDIDCLDYNAVCVESQNGDYCGCPKGTEFDEQEGKCVRQEVDVPEFGAVGALVVTVLSGLALVFFRKR